MSSRIYVYAKFSDDRLWNEKALADRKSDDNNTKNDNNKWTNNIYGGHWGPVLGSKIQHLTTRQWRTHSAVTSNGDYGVHSTHAWMLRADSLNWSTFVQVDIAKIKRCLLWLTVSQCRKVSAACVYKSRQIVFIRVVFEMVRDSERTFQVQADGRAWLNARLPYVNSLSLSDSWGVGDDQHRRIRQRVSQMLATDDA